MKYASLSWLAYNRINSHSITDNIVHVESENDSKIYLQYYELRVKKVIIRSSKLKILQKFVMYAYTFTDWLLTIFFLQKHKMNDEIQIEIWAIELNFWFDRLSLLEVLLKCLSILGEINYFGGNFKSCFQERLWLL